MTVIEHLRNFRIGDDQLHISLSDIFQCTKAGERLDLFPISKALQEVDDNSRAKNLDLGELLEALEEIKSSLSCCYPLNEEDSNLRPGGHQYDDLVEILQSQAIEDFIPHVNARDQFKLLQKRTDWDSPTVSDVDIGGYATMFDICFFFGELNKRVEVSWTWTILDDSGDSRCYQVLSCKSHGNISSMKIGIDNAPLESQYPALSGRQRMHRVLGSLLHQLCHAVIDIYGDNSSAERQFTGWGFTGHGWKWSTLFEGLVNRTNEIFGIEINARETLDWAQMEEVVAMEKSTNLAGADEELPAVRDHVHCVRDRRCRGYK